MNSCSKLVARSAVPRAARWNLAVGSPARNCKSWGQRRGLQTGKVDKKLMEKLPLAGIRVLDMTRVLAGVGCFLFGEVA